MSKPRKILVGRGNPKGGENYYWWREWVCHIDQKNRPKGGKNGNKEHSQTSGLIKSNLCSS